MAGRFFSLPPVEVKKGTSKEAGSEFVMQVARFSPCSIFLYIRSFLKQPTFCFFPLTHLSRIQLQSNDVVYTIKKTTSVFPPELQYCEIKTRLVPTICPPQYRRDWVYLKNANTASDFKTSLMCYRSSRRSNPVRLRGGRKGERGKQGFHPA